MKRIAHSFALFVATIWPLSASSAIDHANDKNWQQVVELALSMSSAEHGGHADISRACYPDMKFCEVKILYHSGKSRTITSSFYDVNDAIYSRSVCVSNGFDDIMTCTDFDTNAKYKSMKSPDGVWHSVQ